MACKVIGLTGQTGAGKSVIRDYFEEQGIAAVDADTVAHDVMDNELDCLVEVVERFSCMVLNVNGKLDRKRLGRIVFTDKKQLLALNRIVFPYISGRIAQIKERAEAAGEVFLVIDAAALFESGCDKLCDAIVSVTAEPAIRLERIMKRDGISRKDAENRVTAQHEDRYYTDRSDFVIINNMDTLHLRTEAQRVFAGIIAGEYGERHGAAGEVGN